MATAVTVAFGMLANIGVLMSFRVSLEHRLTRLETMVGGLLGQHKPAGE